MRNTFYITSGDTLSIQKYIQLVEKIKEEENIETFNVQIVVANGLDTDDVGKRDPSKSKDVYILEIENDGSYSMRLVKE